ncbi:MAG: hypothetical protein IKQ46_05615 [Bacteroidales bacterium]|nr:hypothetical protein [Bacteroidales bacterium]
MDRQQRIVAGLDVHKDTVFLCIMDNSEVKKFLVSSSYRWNCQTIPISKINKNLPMSVKIMYGRHR